jgi:hypothetical protein
MTPLPTTQVQQVEVLPAVSEDADDQAVRDKSAADYEFARQNITDAIVKGQEALDGILEVARIGQHPRSFEVAATLVKSVVDANKELLALSKQQQEITTAGKPTQGPAGKTTNNLFVGSTADLLRMLKNPDASGE